MRLPILLNLFFIHFLFIHHSFGQCDSLSAEFEIMHPTCPGFSDGGVHITPFGGTPEYEVFLTDTEGTLLSLDGVPEINLLSAGWYYIEIVDSLGCVYIDSVELIDPPSLFVEDDIVINPSEPGACDGSIEILEVDGVDLEALTFFWSPDPDGISGLGAYYFPDACDGIYTVTYMTPIGCTHTHEYAVGSLAGINENPTTTPKISLINQELRIPGYDHFQHIAIYSITGRLIYEGMPKLSIPLQTEENFIIYRLTNDNQITYSGKLSNLAPSE